MYQRKPTAASDQRGAGDREIELVRARGDQGLRRADVREHRHRREREERDDRRAGGEPVETVAEVDAVRGAGDHEEDEDVPERPERQPIARAGNEHRRQIAQPRAVREVARARGDTGEQQQLPAARQTERALVRELDEVVEEADRAAAERDEEHGQPRQLVLREREERDRRRNEDEDAARRRRALLDDVPLGPLLADLLAELLSAEEVDEARSGDDRDEARHDAGDEDSGHAVTPASASATRSRPRTRAPLTSTQSPGLSSSRSSAIASSASATGAAAVDARALADRDEHVHADLVDGARDLAVRLVAVVAELGHLAEDGDAAAPVGEPTEVLERGAHRDRVRVPRVVDQQPAAGQRQLLVAPLGERHVDALGDLEPERTRRREGDHRVGRKMLCAEVDLGRADETYAGAAARTIRGARPRRRGRSRCRCGRRRSPPARWPSRRAAARRSARSSRERLLRGRRPSRGARVQCS